MPIFIALLALIAAALFNAPAGAIEQSIVIAQSGSAGGSIGKQGKSATSHDDQPQSQPAKPPVQAEPKVQAQPQPVKPRVAVRARASDEQPNSAADCNNLAGTPKENQDLPAAVVGTVTSIVGNIGRCVLGVGKPKN